MNVVLPVIVEGPDGARDRCSRRSSFRRARGWAAPGTQGRGSRLVEKSLPIDIRRSKGLPLPLMGSLPQIMAEALCHGGRATARAWAPHATVHRAWFAHDLPRAPA